MTDLERARSLGQTQNRLHANLEAQKRRTRVPQAQAVMTALQQAWESARPEFESALRAGDGARALAIVTAVYRVQAEITRRASEVAIEYDATLPELLDRVTRGLEAGARGALDGAEDLLRATAIGAGFLLLAGVVVGAWLLFGRKGS